MTNNHREPQGARMKTVSQPGFLDYIVELTRKDTPIDPATPRGRIVTTLITHGTQRALQYIDQHTGHVYAVAAYQVAQGRVVASTATFAIHS